MAIKISNTTVINDSRQLENITNLKTVGGQSILGTGDIQTFVATNGIYVNTNVVATSFEVPSGSNAMSAGPMSINSNVTVTVAPNSVWTIV